MGFHPRHFRMQNLIPTNIGSSNGEISPYVFHLDQVVEVDGRPKIEVEYKNETKAFFAEEVSSMVLTKMKEVSFVGKVVG